MPLSQAGRQRSQLAAGKSELRQDPGPETLPGRLRNLIFENAPESRSVPREGSHKPNLKRWLCKLEWLLICSHEIQWSRSALERWFPLGQLGLSLHALSRSPGHLARALPLCKRETHCPRHLAWHPLPWVLFCL